MVFILFSWAQPTNVVFKGTHLNCIPEGRFYLTLTMEHKYVFFYIEVHNALDIT